MATSTFFKLLSEQVRNEFTAAQQYTAIAVWYDSQDLPRLASRFYDQAVEERNHAMMMVQYLLDRDQQVQISGIDDVRNDFGKITEPLQMSVDMEQKVTTQIEDLFRAARDAGDPMGEQFMMWFLKEQTEEVASMKSLLTIAERAQDSWFQIEEHLNREQQGESADPSAPPAAGGSIALG